MTKTNRKRTAVASSGTALAAALLAGPALAAPAPEAVQQAKSSSPAPSARTTRDAKHTSNAITLNFSKIRSEYKHKGEYSIVGEDRGRTVFEDERGNLFYIDQASGDQKFLIGDIYLKREAARYGSHIGKSTGKVTIIGVDAQGKVIMSNPRGEQFYLDSETGDIVLTGVLVTGRR